MNFETVVLLQPGSDPHGPALEPDPGPAAAFEQRVVEELHIAGLVEPPVSRSQVEIDTGVGGVIDRERIAQDLARPGAELEFAGRDAGRKTREAARRQHGACECNQQVSKAGLRVHR